MSPHPASPSRAKALSWWIACVLTLGVIAVYGQTLGFDFVNFDDPGYVSENPQVREGLTGRGVVWAFTTSFKGHWHPLTWLSLMLDATIGGGAEPWIFHLTNLLLHLANALLVFHVLRRMTGRLLPSGCVAALFALHPLHVESVAWVTERKDLLSTFFWLLTMLAWTRAVERPGVVRHGLALAFCALGLLAKPMLVTLPLVLLLLDVWPFERLGRPRRAIRSAERQAGAETGSASLGGERSPLAPLRGERPAPAPLGALLVEKSGFFALAAASVAATLIASERGGATQSSADYPPLVRLENGLVSYAAYLVKTIWPSSLAVYYPHPGASIPLGRVVLAALALAVLTIAAVRAVRGRPYLFVGWFWYLVTLLPVIGIVQVGGQAMADRYTYVPLIGVFIALVWGAADLLSPGVRSPGAEHGAGERPGERGKASRRRASISLGGLGTLGVPRALGFAAFGAALAALTGAAFVQASHWRDSKTLMTHALRVTENNALAHANLASALFLEGRHDEAIEHWRKAVGIAPEFADAESALCGALMQTGAAEEGLAHCAEALGRSPSHAGANTNVGLLLLGRGQVDEAMERFRTSLRERPDHAVTRRALGVALASKGRFEEAEDQLALALRADPGSIETRLHLARVLAQLGRRGEAEALYRSVLKDDARNEYALKGLGALGLNSPD